MMSNEASLAIPAEIEDLFDLYRDGFDDFDAATIAECFAFPVTIWQLGRGNVFTEEEDLLENIEKLLDVLEGEDIVATDYDVLEADCGQAGGHARLQWSQSREDGEEALSFICRYAFIRGEDGGLRIALVVNE